MPKYGRISRNTKYADLMVHNRTRGRIGRNWPPTTLRAEFENYIEHDVRLNAINDASEAIALQLAMSPDWSDSGIFSTVSALGTRTAFTAQAPRNWTSIVPLYRRGRLLSMDFLLKIDSKAGVDGNAALDWYVSSWLSSSLDKTNPITALDAAVGVAAPFNADNDFRDLLLKSRRVHTEILKATQKNGTGVLTIKYKLNPFVDRVGNMMVGGKHVRVATDHGGGTALTTDKAVAALLTDPAGVDSRINIVLYPVESITVSPRLGSFHIWSRTHVELYDRVHDT